MSADDQFDNPVNNLVPMEERQIARYETAVTLADKPTGVPALPEKTYDRKEGQRDVSTFEGVREIIVKRQWESPADKAFLFGEQRKFVQLASPLLHKMEEQIQGLVEKTNGSLGDAIDTLPTAQVLEKEAEKNNVYPDRALKGILGAAADQVALEMEVELKRRELEGKPQIYDQDYEDMRNRLENERFWDHDIDFGQSKAAEPDDTPQAAAAGGPGGGAPGGPTGGGTGGPTGPDSSDLPFDEVPGGGAGRGNGGGNGPQMHYPWEEDDDWGRNQGARYGAQAAPGLGMNQDQFTEAMFQAYYRAMKEFQYGAGPEYEEWLQTEELNTSPTPVVDRAPHPEYWKYLNPQEKEILNKRRELNNLAVAKRVAVSDLDTYGKLNEVKSIETKEVRLLYERMPGFRQALEEYVSIFTDPDQDGNKITVMEIGQNGQMSPRQIGIREVKTEDQAEEFRYLVRRKIIDQHLEPTFADAMRQRLRQQDQPLTPEQIEAEVEALLNRRAQEAEQAAQNALFGTNGFESMIQLWSADGRLDVKTFDTLYMGRFVSAPLVEEIYPLTTAIDKANKGENHGKHAAYIRAQVDRLKAENGGRLKYDAIQIVDANTEAQARATFWRLRQEQHGGRTIVILQVPEVYPRKLIDSPWERNRIKEPGGVERSIMDYLRSKDRVPWELMQTSEFTGKYGRDAGKAHTISEAQLKVQPYRPEVETEKWEFKLSGAETKLPDHANLNRNRWIFNQQIYPDDNVPYMEGDYAYKLSQEEIVSGRTLGYGIFNNKKDLFFPWDSKNTKKIRKVK